MTLARAEEGALPLCERAFRFGQCISRVRGLPARVADRGVQGCTPGNVAEHDVTLRVHPEGPLPAIVCVGRRVGALLEHGPRIWVRNYCARVAMQLVPVEARVGFGASGDGVGERQGLERTEVPIDEPLLESSSGVGIEESRVGPGLREAMLIRKVVAASGRAVGETRRATLSVHARLPRRAGAVGWVPSRANAGV